MISGILAVKIRSTDLTHENFSKTFARLERMSIKSFFGNDSNPVIPKSISLVGRESPVAQDPKILKSVFSSAEKEMKI